MGKKRRGGGAGGGTSRPSISTSAAGSTEPPEQPPDETATAPSGPIPMPLVQLARHVHVANAGCAGRCRPCSALQAQAQAQPRHLSFRVTSAVLGHLSEGDGHVLVLALSTPQPTLLLRVAHGIGSKGGSSPRELEEGDYLYEFLGLPSATVTAAAGAGGRRGVGGGLAAAGAQVACLALSEDGGRLLCVMREGNAHGLRTREVLQAATRMYDNQPQGGGDEQGGDADEGDEDESGRRQQERRRHPWTANPFGPSLLEYAMDPRYHREGPGVAGGMGGGRRAKDISLGSQSTEGDFEPHCCVWWTPAVAVQAGGRLPASNMAIIGGVSGGRGALSIVDMDQEREVDLIYLTPPTTDDDTGRARGGAAVVSLRIYTLPPPSPGPGTEAGQQRLLLATLAGGAVYSLVLESPQDPTPDLAAYAPASSSASASVEDGGGGGGGGSASSSPPRPRRLSSSLLATPTKQQQQQPGRRQLPSPSPGTPPARSSSPSLSQSLSSSPLSTVPASPSSSFSSLLTAGTPQRHQQGKKGRRKGSSSAQPGPGFFPASSLGESVEEELRDASSLWDRCFARVDPSASGPMPRQPRPRRCFPAPDAGARRLFEGKGEEEGADAAALACPLQSEDGVEMAVVCLLSAVGGEQQGATGALVARMELPGEEAEDYQHAVVALESHACSSAAPESGAASPASCRALGRVPVEEDLDRLAGPTRALWVERLLEARLLSGPQQRLLALSLACTEEDDEDDDETAAGVPSFWLAVYSLGGSGDDEQAAAPRLLRAFRSPTGSSVRCLGALPPAPLAIRDVLALAPTRLFLDGGEGGSGGQGPEGMAAWSLVLWSRCSVLLLRVLGHDGGAAAATAESPLLDAASVPVAENTLRPALASGLGVLSRKAQREQQQQRLNPGELLGFVEALARGGDAGRWLAITLAWRLLLDAPPPPKGPALHGAFFSRLKGADPLLLPGGSGRAELALACLGWMMAEGGDDAADASVSWGKEELLLFLEACTDYPLASAVDALLGRGRVSEALFASWARGKVPGVARTLERLAALASASDTTPSPSSSPCRRVLPLTRSDVAWLCGVGAGRALVEAGRSLLWASLPRRLQLDVLLANQHLLLMPDQYQDLLAALPTLPKVSLAAVALQLAFWVGVGPQPKDEEPPPLPMSPRLMVSTSPQRGARGGAGEQAQQRPVRLVAAWASEEALASGLAAAVDGFLLAKPPPQDDDDGAGEPEQPDEDEEDGSSEEEERERRDRRRLADLLLHALLLLARPLARTRLALQAHALAAAAATVTPPTRPMGLALPARAALEAQVLLERLVREWAHISSGSAASSSSSSAAAASAFSRNPRFTPAVLLALAMAGTGTGNTGVAALVLEAAGRAEAALELRLEEAAAVSKAPAGSENLEEELVALLLGLVRTHVLPRGGAGVEWATRRRMAARVLEAWARLALSPAPLEALVLEEREGGGGWERHMLMALLVDLLVLHAGEPGSPADAQGAILGQLRLSPQVYVRLCQHVVDHGREMQLEGVTDLWSTGGRASGLLRFPRPLPALWEALYQQIQGLEAQAAASQRIELPAHKLREASTRSRGSLTFGAGVGRAAFQGRRIVVGSSAEEERVVAFNCGHVLGETELLQRALPALETQLTQGLDRPLHLTTEMLSQEYREMVVADKSAAVACPACVTAHLAKVVARQEAREGAEQEFVEDGDGDEDEDASL